jgi:hypothetical protein
MPPFAGIDNASLSAFRLALQGVVLFSPLLCEPVGEAGLLSAGGVVL